MISIKIRQKQVLFRCLSTFLLNQGTSNAEEPNNRKPATAVVVQSFKGYERFWQACFTSLCTYLPKGLPVYFITDDTGPLESKAYEQFMDTITPVCTGEGSFAARGLKGLLKLPPNIRYVVYLQEDMWITKHISQGYIQEIVQCMQALRLKGAKICEGSFHPDDYSQIACDKNKVGIGREMSAYWFLESRYSMSHHITIFERRFLTKAFALGALFDRGKPFEHEVFVSNILAHLTTRESHSLVRFPIVLLDKSFHVPYVHASSGGFLTASGAQWLAMHGLSDHGHIYSR